MGPLTNFVVWTSFIFGKTQKIADFDYLYIVLIPYSYLYHRMEETPQKTRSAKSSDTRTGASGSDLSLKRTGSHETCLEKILRESVGDSLWFTKASNKQWKKEID